MVDDTPQKPRYELMALSAKGGFLQVIKDEKVWAREIMFALQILRGSDALQKVDQESIKNAVVNIALCGTTLNPAMNMAYLVPRDGKCCLDISYRGLAAIAMDSGSVKHVAPRLVYSFDKFEFWEEDGEPHVKHAPEFNPPPEFAAGPEKFWDYLVCGYVVATLHDGTKIVTQPLPKWKLEKAMKTSKTSSGKTPWRTHPDEMCLKTLVKHAYKLLPQTDRMSNAVTILNEHEGMDTSKASGGGGSAKELMDRFGFRAEAEDAEIVPQIDEKAQTSCSPSNDEANQEAVCPKCEGDGYYIDDGIEDGGGEVYCDCTAGSALKAEQELGATTSECTHPEDARIIESNVTSCGTCGLVLETAPIERESQPELATETVVTSGMDLGKNEFTVIKIDPKRSCCMPPQRAWRLFGTVKVLYCEECGLIHRKFDVSDPGREREIEFVLGEAVL